MPEQMVKLLSYLGIIFITLPFAPLSIIFVPIGAFINFKWEKYWLKRLYSKPKVRFHTIATTIKTASNSSHKYCITTLLSYYHYNHHYYNHHYYFLLQHTATTATTTTTTTTTTITSTTSTTNNHYSTITTTTTTASQVPMD